MTLTPRLPNPFNRPLCSVEDYEITILSHISDIVGYGALLERRALVDRVPKIGSVYVYADHNPPHFHVRGSDFDLTIALQSGKVLRGSPLNSQQRKALDDWYLSRGGKELVIELWNKCNPENKLEVA